MFTCAVLGDIYSAMLGFNELGFDGSEEENNVQFNTQIRLDDDEIELSLIVPQKVQDEGDSLLEMADGVVFFLDPNDLGILKKLKDILDKLVYIRADYPIIIIVDTQDLIIKTEINSILSWLWLDYGAGVFFIPKKQYKMINDYILHLCYSMISNRPILNPEMIWLQYPQLIREINSQIGVQNWKKAAELAERLCYISKITRAHDTLVYSEKAAVLYSKAGEFLKAANIIKQVNPVYAKMYQRKYTEGIIEEGNQFFNDGEYEQAAIKYEMAGNWVRMELDDEELMQKSYVSAIRSWIAECEVQNGFRILEKFDHDDMIKVLEEVTEDIARLADSLTDKGMEALAKAQLYLCFQRYQKVGLFDSLDVLARKAVKILKKILYRNLDLEDADAAKLSFDELTTIWETYEIPPENVDELVYQMVKLFIDRRDFQKVEVLIPKIQNIEMQNELTAIRVKNEEKIKELTRKGELKELYHMVDLLNGYIFFENGIFNSIIEDTKQQISVHIQKNEFELAEFQFLEKASWFARIGQEDYANQTWLELLKMYLSKFNYEKLFHHLPNVPENFRKQFLKDNIHQIVNGFGSLKKNKKLEEYEEYLTKFIRVYRNHLLYDESRMLSKVLIENFIGVAEQMSYNIVKGEGVQKLLDIVVKINALRGAYLEDEKISLDSIYVKIVKFLVDSADYKDARIYAEKIANSDLSASYIEKIDKKVTEINRSQVEKVQKSQYKKIFAEKLSQLQNKARDQRLASKNLLRMRSGLKRRYFQDSIALFKDKKYYDAAERYLAVAKDLASTKKNELAGVNLGVVTLIFLMLENISALKHELYKFKKDPRVNYDIFQRTFAAQLIDYILEMIESNYPDNLKSAIDLFKVFPFFPEEQLILETLQGQNIEYKDLLSKHQEFLDGSQDQIPSNYKMLIDKIVPNIQLRNKRSTLELKYWGDCQDHFARQEYSDASLAYLEQSFNMLKRNYPDFAIVSLLMGFITQLKYRTQEQTYREYEKFIFQYGKQFDTLIQAEEIKLLELVLRYWNLNEAEELIVDVLTAFEKKLSLFDWEISFIHRLLQKFDQEAGGTSEAAQSDATTSISPSDEEDSLLSQQAIVLSQDISQLKDNFAQLLTKRQKTVRTYYADILSEIKKNKLLDASKRYLKLSKRMARRNDFDSASLMILLSTLSKIHGGVSLSQIQAELDENLNTLGLVKKILVDYFGVKLAYFTLDLLNGKNESIKPYLETILAQLPLLDEEKPLIQI